LKSKNAAPIEICTFGKSALIQQFKSVLIKQSSPPKWIETYLKIKQSISFRFDSLHEFNKAFSRSKLDTNCVNPLDVKPEHTTNKVNPILLTLTLRGRLARVSIAYQRVVKQKLIIQIKTLVNQSMILK